MSAKINAKPVEDVVRQALKDFATSVLEVAAPLGVQAFAIGPAHDESVEVIHNADRAFGTHLTGSIASKLDDEGLDIGDAHISTQLALFAQGRATSPIVDIAVAKKRMIPVASAVTKVGAVAATCTLTTTLTYERPDANGQRIVTTFANVALDFRYTSPKKTLVAGLGPFDV